MGWLLLYPFKFIFKGNNSVTLVVSAQVGIFTLLIYQ